MRTVVDNNIKFDILGNKIACYAFGGIRVVLDLMDSGVLIQIIIMVIQINSINIRIQKIIIPQMQLSTTANADFQHVSDPVFPFVKETFIFGNIGMYSELIRCIVFPLK
jgi:hypothetical protein